MKNEMNVLPEFGEFQFLKLISNQFPVSDFYHVVVTKALTYMCHCLSICKIENLNDIRSSIFLTLMIYHYQLESKRVCFELVKFLDKLVVHLPLKNEKSKNTIENYLLATKAESKKKSNVLTKLTLHKDIKKNSNNKNLLIKAMLDCIEKIFDLFKNSQSFPELFESICLRLKNSLIENKELNSQLKELLKNYAINRARIQGQRKPLTVLKVKPQAPRQFEPLIFGDYTGGIMDENKLRLKKKILKKKN